jgi:preprotein translocase subunit YajC
MSSQLSNLVFIAAMVAIFYFLLIRPQQRRAKAQRDMLAELAPGMQIVTIGGIYATVVEVGERVRVRVVDGSELEIAKAGISRVVEPEAIDAEDDTASE